MLRIFLTVIFIAQCSLFAFSQDNVVLAHSHNDYNNEMPFWMAYHNNCGSIEVDVWEISGQLFVAHDENEILSGRTFDSLYLMPVVNSFRANGGKAWAKRDGYYQLMIELKTATEPALSVLVKKLMQFRDVFDDRINKNAIRVVITGNIPGKESFHKYPEFIRFDGNLREHYTKNELEKIALFSSDLKEFTSWNGKGSIPVDEKLHLCSVIDSVHHIGSKIRFWDAPDNINAWKILINIGVDYINTDHISQLSGYLAKRDKCQYVATERHLAYKPTFRSDNINRNVKNVILLIGDGMGLSQLYSGYTANGGSLSIFNMRSIGFSKTSSSDSYNTDSAAGGTAIATGKKTYNRSIGCDTTRNPISNIPEIISKEGLKSGIVSVGDITDATPAVFYAHQSERSLSEKIALDFLSSPVQVLIGGNQSAFMRRSDGRNLFNELRNSGWLVYSDLDSAKYKKGDKLVVLDDKKVCSKIEGRKDFLPGATRMAIDLLEDSPKGFFMMSEGAQIDWGGHFNNMQYVVRELLDFDLAVAEALRFADKNGETLVIVTADHECGGLTILDGNYNTGMVDGQFSSIDHTGVMVPVFAYGPHSSDFCGVYENTEIFNKIMNLLKVKK